VELLLAGMVPSGMTVFQGANQYRHIALMLGRLRVSTEDALNAYAQLAGYVFKEKKLPGKDGVFKASRLEEAIKKIVRQYGEHGNPDEEMLDARSDSGVCKT